MGVTFIGKPSAPEPQPPKKKFGHGNQVKKGEGYATGSGGRSKLPEGVTWKTIEREYVEHNAHNPGQPYTHQMIADKYSITHSSVVAASKRYAWGQKVTEARLLLRGLDQANFAGLVFNEAEVRRQQAEIANTVAMRAFQRLLEIDPSELGPKESRMLLQLGLEQQRKALGLPDTFAFVPATPGQAGATVQDAVTEMDKVKRLGNAFLTFIKAKQSGQANAVIDVQATEVKAG